MSSRGTVIKCDSWIRDFPILATEYYFMNLLLSKAHFSIKSPDSFIFAYSSHLAEFLLTLVETNRETYQIARHFV